MDFMDVVRKRRSIRRYKPDHVPKEVLSQVLEAARLAPSGGNCQPWHFVVVKDSDTKGKLGIGEFASAAPVVIVGCADPVDPAAAGTYLIDVSIAFEHIVLAAANFGLGTCWQLGWSAKPGAEEAMKKLLGVPEHMKIVAVTPLGYPADPPRPKDTKALSEIVHYEKF
jgi:nitroreductase